MAFLPYQGIQQEIRPILKGPRPYKIGVTETTPPNTSPDVKPNKKENYFQPIIIAASNRHNVDPALVKAIIMAESNYNPVAVSKRGAKGLMQLMPNTADALGVEDSFNPKHNIDGGVKYLRQLLNKFEGNLQLAVAAYNAGSKKVMKYQGVPPFKVTRNYVKKVFEYYQHYKKEMKQDNRI